MAERNDDLPPPSPGGFMRDPGPAGPERAEQTAVERIAQALEDLRAEVRPIRELLERERAGRRS